MQFMHYSLLAAARPWLSTFLVAVVDVAVVADFVVIRYIRFPSHHV